MAVIRDLGYPSKQTLHKWVRTDLRYAVSTHAQKAVSLENVKKIPTEVKIHSVAAIYQRNKIGQQLANQYHICRKTLYGWKNNFLGTYVQIQPAKLKCKIKVNDSDIVTLRAKVDELEL